MSAFGLEERRATLARIQTINAGRAWLGSVADDYQVPREEGSGRILPHTVISFGAPVKTSRDRNMAYGEKHQPHILWAQIACVAGDADAAQALAAAVHDLLLDWAPSENSDPYESTGGFGTRRPSTEATPTRYIEGLHLEAVVNSVLLP